MKEQSADASLLILERAMGIELTSEAWEASSPKNDSSRVPELLMQFAFLTVLALIIRMGSGR